MMMSTIRLVVVFSSSSACKISSLLCVDVLEKWRDKRYSREEFDVRSGKSRASKAKKETT